MSSSREQIIEAALKLADASGLAATNIRAVAEAAGYSPSLVVRLFQTRGGLVGEMFSRSQGDLIQRAREASETEGDPATRCVRVFEQILDADLTRIDLRREIMANAWSLDPKEKLAADRELEQVLPIFADIVSDVGGLASYQDRIEFSEAMWAMYLCMLRKHLAPGVEKPAILEPLARFVHTLIRGAGVSEGG